MIATSWETHSIAPPAQATRVSFACTEPTRRWRSPPDCNPRYVTADPFEGGKQAVAEAYRNLCAVGADPVAITDNLNFGSPERPATMGVIVKAIEGMALACAELNFPVVSGNVSCTMKLTACRSPRRPLWLVSA